MKSFALLLTLACGSAAHAEVIQLLDNTQVSGKILHYYDGIFGIEAAGGEKLDIPANKIKSITFKLPPARAEFATPEKTFARYRDAITKGDVTKLLDCYGLMYQGMLAQQLQPDEFAKMKKELEGTKFEIKSSKISGQTAVIKVQRTKAEDSETAEIHMVLENGEWKMTP